MTISIPWLIAFASAYLSLLIAIRFDWMRRNGYDPHSGPYHYIWAHHAALGMLGAMDAGAYDLHWKLFCWLIVIDDYLQHFILRWGSSPGHIIPQWVGWYDRKERLAMWLIDRGWVRIGLIVSRL